jgi:DNA-binding MarR family transcriptional regulator
MVASSGTQFAQLLMRAFEVMVAEVRVSLEGAGHPGLTVGNELAMQAIDHGASSAASLARETGVTRQAAAKTISTLESLGYVTRDADPADARKKHLHVTAEGRAAISVGAAAFDRIFARWQQQDESASRAAVVALEKLITLSRSTQERVR